MNGDDFYIGYLDASPPTLRRHTRRVVLILGVLIAVMTALVAARQQPAEPGFFEFGHPQSFEGVLLEKPLPLLRVATGSGAATNYVLVGAGKHGLPAFARGHDGERVRFEGTLIRKGPAVAVELGDAGTFMSLGPAPSATPPAKSDVVGDVVLTGELVDTKCYLGVMRPATGKVHRACAVRCLSGGIPPGLLVRDADGGGVVVFLAGRDGRALNIDPQWAARGVRAAGRLSVRENLL